MYDSIKIFIVSLFKILNVKYKILIGTIDRKWVSRESYYHSYTQLFLS
jgi:hypothetical protein